MSGGGSGGGSAPANTTANNTETVIQQAPAYSQQYISDLLGQAATSAAQPYQQFPGQEVAGFSPDQTNAFSQIEGLTGNGTGGAAATQGAAANNLAASGANTANGIAASGSPYLQASALYNPSAAASPYEAASAAATTPQGISSYMSPYLNNEIQGLETTAQQNFNQFTAPSVNDSFIGAGQFGSGRNTQVMGQQANLANQALTGQIASAENAAYTTAGQQAAAAGSNLSGLGSLAGTTAASEAANLQNIGTGLGNLASTQAGAQGNAATNLANTANTVQNTGITGASALQDVGQQQQNLAQTNINTALSNFNAQNLWPETQESFLNSIINGLPSPGSSTTSAGQTPATTGQIGSVSPLSGLAGSLIGAAGLGSTSAAKRGGLIKGYASGGVVSSDDSAGGPMSFMDALLSGWSPNGPPTDGPSSVSDAIFNGYSPNAPPVSSDWDNSVPVLSSLGSALSSPPLLATLPPSNAVALSASTYPSGNTPWDNTKSAISDFAKSGFTSPPVLYQQEHPDWQSASKNQDVPTGTTSVMPSPNDDDDERQWNDAMNGATGASADFSASPLPKGIAPPPSAPAVDAALAAYAPSSAESAHLMSSAGPETNRAVSGNYARPTESPLPDTSAPLHAANDQPSPSSQPISFALGGNSNYGITPTQMKNYQLLAMAKGFLTPAHSGAEALGNAIGNYGQAGMEWTKLQNDNALRMLEAQNLAAWRQGQLGVNQQKAATGQEKVNYYGQRVNDQGAIGQQNANTAAARERDEAVNYNGTKTTLASLQSLLDSTTDPKKQADIQSAIDRAVNQAGQSGATATTTPSGRIVQPAAQTAPTPQSSKVVLPQVGEVRGGYMFNGGNPADRANWAPATPAGQ